MSKIQKLNGSFVMSMYLSYDVNLGDAYDFQFVYSNGGEL